MKTYKQTLFISIISTLLLLSAVSKVHAAGTVHFFLSGGGLVDSLQSFESSDSDDARDPDSESGAGFLLDFIFNERHAIAVDSYAFTEEYDNIGDSEARGLLLGYRHHFPSGFYLGGGIMDASFSVSIPLVGGGNFKFDYDDTNVLGLTLGYQTAFANGLSLGAHLLYSLPEDIEGELSGTKIRVEDASIQSLGFIIGYAWGGNG